MKQHFKTFALGVAVFVASTLPLVALAAVLSNGTAPQMADDAARAAEYAYADGTLDVLRAKTPDMMGWSGEAWRDAVRAACDRKTGEAVARGVEVSR